MGFLQKIGRWGAGRIQGSKGVQKYDDWMERNPLARTALNVGDVVGIGALSGGLGLGAKAATVGGGALAATAKPGMMDAAKAGIKGAILGGDGKLGVDDLGRTLKSVGSFAKNNMDLIGAGIGAYGAMQSDQDANRLRDRALGIAEQDAARRGQFSDMAMAKLGNVQRPQLGGLFAGSGNPYAQPQQSAMPAAPEQAVAPRASAAMAAFKQPGNILKRVGAMRRAF